MASWLSSLFRMPLVITCFYIIILQRLSFLNVLCFWHNITAPTNAKPSKQITRLAPWHHEKHGFAVISQYHTIHIQDINLNTFQAYNWTINLMQKWRIQLSRQFIYAIPALSMSTHTPRSSRQHRLSHQFLFQFNSTLSLQLPNPM